MELLTEFTAAEFPMSKLQSTDFTVGGIKNSEFDLFGNLLGFGVLYFLTVFKTFASAGQARRAIHRPESSAKIKLGPSSSREK